MLVYKTVSISMTKKINFKMLLRIDLVTDHAAPHSFDLYSLLDENVGQALSVFTVIGTDPTPR